MEIEKLVAQAPEWTDQTWAQRMDQAASTLFLNGYITASVRSKITEKIERQFRDGIEAGRIIAKDATQ